MKLKYNGNGSQHITGIPAQDLSETDIDRLIADGLFISVQDAIDSLTSRNLYSVVKPPKQASKKTDDTEIAEDES